MSSFEADIARKTLQWLKSGEEDLRLARHGLTLSSACPYHLIAYHAQQCAEKHVKAYLVYHKVDFPYTHDFAHLRELCTQGGDPFDELKDAEELTPYAVSARYPVDDEEVSSDEALRAIDLAAQVRESITAALRRDGLTL